ncbi:calmodulin-like protein 5 isoform X1 [Biomphalaria pfeifferi]|uniref:Calmodulin-like protein 5 isoform X1 n=1 Tax=Biomphalaria pfeifferi TaxID=112525 RepID=A0AAD8EXE4_BIOPF|nr:calmodulin-like protein 5 isoform X1 [Biomphalaria pfeifferi]
MWRLAFILCLPVMVICQVDITALGNQEFNRLDIDQDGNIEPLETQQYFERFDANHDNRISRQEYAKEVETHHVNNLQAHSILLRLFDALDFDNDNHIDGPDYSDLFIAADINNNRLVSQLEFLRYFYDLTGIDPIGK